jgi:membrane protease subunit (stomatin/prohibitin family)
MVRIRAFGTYNMQVSDPQLFVAQVVGARGYYATSDVANYLRSIIISRLTDILGENMKSILDLPAMFEEISAAARAKLRDDFASLGFGLKQLYVMSISPTEETSAAIDEAASMGAVGDMDRYMKFKTARAIGDAATSTGAAGSTTQMGMGLGTGLAAAKIVADSLAAPTQAPAAQTAAAAAALVTCSKCQYKNPTSARFCNNCGAQLAGTVKCPQCGTENQLGAKFCNNCGAKLG